MDSNDSRVMTGCPVGKSSSEKASEAYKETHMKYENDEDNPSTWNMDFQQQHAHSTYDGSSFFGTILWFVTATENDNFQEFNGGGSHIFGASQDELFEHSFYHFHDGTV
jgi:hypothetical protein